MRITIIFSRAQTILVASNNFVGAIMAGHKRDYKQLNMGTVNK